MNEELSETLKEILNISSFSRPCLNLAHPLNISYAFAGWLEKQKPPPEEGAKMMLRLSNSFYYGKPLDEFLISVYDFYYRKDN